MITFFSNDHHHFCCTIPGVFSKLIWNSFASESASSAGNSVFYPFSGPFVPTLLSPETSICFWWGLLPFPFCHSRLSRLWSTVNSAVKISISFTVLQRLLGTIFQLIVGYRKITKNKSAFWIFSSQLCNGISWPPEGFRLKLRSKPN